MEGLPKQEQANIASERADESIELAESVEKAQELYSKLKKFDNTDVDGSVSFAEVQGLALDLTTVLQTIPVTVRQQEGLPWHPHDAANDETFAAAA